jgi:hypothetical protein
MIMACNSAILFLPITKYLRRKTGIFLLKLHFFPLNLHRRIFDFFQKLATKHALHRGLANRVAIDHEASERGRCIRRQI